MKESEELILYLDTRIISKALSLLDDPELHGLYQSVNSDCPKIILETLPRKRATDIEDTSVIPSKFANYRFLQTIFTLDESGVIWLFLKLPDTAHKDKEQEERLLSYEKNLQEARAEMQKQITGIPPQTLDLDHLKPVMRPTHTMGSTPTTKPFHTILQPPTWRTIEPDFVEYNIVCGLIHPYHG